MTLPAHFYLHGTPGRDEGCGDADSPEAEYLQEGQARVRRPHHHDASVDHHLGLHGQLPADEAESERSLEETERGEGEGRWREEREERRRKDKERGERRRREERGERREEEEGGQGERTEEEETGERREEEERREAFSVSAAVC